MGAIQGEYLLTIKQNWGSTIIPKEKWINPGKSYTCNGHKVIGLQINLFGEGSDREVTFPLRGVLITKKNQLKMDYNLWTLNGKHNIMHDSIYDLVEVKE